jgi:acyl dehydratase
MTDQIVAERTLVAFLDGPDRADIANPIHSTAVATEYGFRAALVGGVTVYGWCAPAIIAALGEEWLDQGWADVAFRQPVYPGDQLTIRVTDAGKGHSLTLANQDGVACLAGTVGLGEAPFLAILQSPSRRTAEPRPADLPWLTLENAPVGEDLRPMAVPLSLAHAEAYATEKQDDAHPRWYGAGARIHPGWLAARMTPLIHHSYDYAPAIHTHTLVQHLAPAFAGQTVTVAGRFVEAFERKDHHYGVVDGVILAEDGTELARLRHTTIFRPAKRAEA